MLKKALTAIIWGALLFLGYMSLKRTDHSTPFTPSPKEHSDPSVNQAQPQPLPTQPSKVPRLSEEDQRLILSIEGPYNTGDFIKAWRMAASLQRQQTSAAFSAWLLGKWDALKVSAAFAFIKQGQCDEAMPLLLTNISGSQAAEVHRGLGFCFYKKRQLDEASLHLTKALALKPKDPQLRLLLADVYESLGKLPEALQELNHALTNTQEKEPQAFLASRIKAMTSKVKEGAFQSRTENGYFIMTYNGLLHEEIVLTVGEILELAMFEFQEVVSLAPPKHPIEVYLYPDELFQDVTQGPLWAQGLFDGRLRIPIHKAWLDGRNLASLQGVLRHELTHALLSQMIDGRSLPGWFDEGLAQKLSCPKMRCGSFPYGVHDGGFFPRDDYFATYSAFDGVKARRIYKQSLFLIYVIERRFGGLDGLRRVIEALSPTAPLDSEALLKPLDGLTFDGLYQEAAQLWGQHIELKDD